MRKPAQEDHYDVKDQNDNMDIIDAEMKKHVKSVNDVTADAKGNVKLTAKEVGAFAFLPNGQGGNLNDFTTMGVKSVQGVSNNPKGTVNFGLVWNICSQDGLHIIQFYFDPARRDIFTRNLSDEIWSGWLLLSVTLVPDK